MPTTELLHHARRHFEQHLGVDLDELLQPIDPRRPAGSSMKASGVHQAIQDARRAEDPHLPQGPWQHELKRADWEAVVTLACDTLRRYCKDLQLAAWLLEAEIHRNGLAGIAPVVVLIEELLRRFGSQLHPQDADGGAPHRANVLRWMNRKLLPVLKQLPLTATGETEFGWADRETAWRNEQHKPTAGAAAEGPALQAVTDAMAATPAGHHLAVHLHLRLALEALADLAVTIDGAFDGEDRPSVAALASLLRQMLGSVDGELRRRGIDPQPAPVAQQPDLPATALTAPVARAAGAAERAHAYEMLEQAMRILLQSDPHSPAPYLVQRAIEWGRLSTSELYRELFIRKGGQMNIFELLGLEVPQAQAE